MNINNQQSNVSSVTGTSIDGTQYCSGHIETTAAATTNVFSEQMEETEPTENIAVPCIQQEELGFMANNGNNESNEKLEQVGCTNEKEATTTTTKTIYLDNDEVTPTVLNRDDHLYNPTPGAHHIIASSLHGTHNNQYNSTTLEGMGGNNDNNNSNNSSFAVVANAELVVTSRQNENSERTTVGAVAVTAAGGAGAIDEEAHVHKPAEVTESQLHKRNARFWFRVAMILFFILAAVLVLVLFVLPKPSPTHKKHHQPTTKPTMNYIIPTDDIFNLNPFESNYTKFATFTQHVFLLQSRVQCASFGASASENPDMMIIKCYDASIFVNFIKLESSSNNLDCQPEGDEIIRCNMTNTTDQLSYVVFTCAGRARDEYLSMTEITTFPLTGSSCQTDPIVRVTSAQICPVDTTGSTSSNSSTIQLIPSAIPEVCEIGYAKEIGNLTFCQEEAPQQCPFGQYPCNTTVGPIMMMDSSEICEPMFQYQPLDPVMVNLEIESFFGNVVPDI